MIELLSVWIRPPDQVSASPTVFIITVSNVKLCIAYVFVIMTAFYLFAHVAMNTCLISPLNVLLSSSFLFCRPFNWCFSHLFFKSAWNRFSFFITHSAKYFTKIGAILIIPYINKQYGFLYLSKQCNEINEHFTILNTGLSYHSKRYRTLNMNNCVNISIVIT